MPCDITETRAPHSLTQRGPPCGRLTMFDVPFKLHLEWNKFRGPSVGETYCGRVEVFERARLRSLLPAHPLQHLLIRLFDLPKILSEPIFVH